MPQNANSGDPEQTPQNAASDLGLHCLPRSQKWDARLIWVKSTRHFVFCFLTFIFYPNLFVGFRFFIPCVFLFV